MRNPKGPWNYLSDVNRETSNASTTKDHVPREITPYIFVVGAFLMILTCVEAGVDKYTDDGEFFRTYSDLREVPTDIPDETKEVYLYGNQITQYDALSR